VTWILRNLPFKACKAEPMDYDNFHMAETTAYMAIAISKGLTPWKAGSSETITGDSFSEIRTCCIATRGGRKADEAPPS